MIGLELISEEIIPLQHTDKGEVALQRMEDLKVKHLPVLKFKNFVGLISENDLLDKVELGKTLTVLFDHLPRPYIYGSSHIYEAIRKIHEDHLTVLPVLDSEEHYLGSISGINLLQKFGETGSINEEGSIIVLEMNDIDYSLGRISQIIENENAKILSSFITSSPLSKKLELTLKIHLLDVGPVLRALERYNYVVKASFQRDSYYDDLHERYDELMKYLNI